MPCPKDPSVKYLDKVIFIKHYAMDTCRTPWRVYVEMGWAAEKNLVLALAGVSSSEAIYTMTRPKMGRAVRHGRSKGERGKAIGTGSKIRKFLTQGEEAIPDSAEVVANTIKLITGWERPIYSDGVQLIFDIVGPIIRSAYYLTMIAATVDFAYDWYSGILLAPESKCDIGRFGFLGAFFTIPNAPYTRIGAYTQQFPPIGCSNTVNGIELDGGTWAVMITIRLEDMNHPPGDWSVFFKLMLGAVTPVQCGKIGHVELVNGENIAFGKLVIKVTSPETLNLYVSSHREGPTFHDWALSIVFEGFRID